MATRVDVYSIDDAEPDDRVLMCITDRHGDEFEVDLSVEEALALAHDLVTALGDEVEDEG